MEALGILTGAYFTFNLGLAFYIDHDGSDDGWDNVKWLGWPLLLLFGGVIVTGIVFHHFAGVAHHWAYAHNLYYRWLIDTLNYERMMGEVNRATKAQLRRMSKANIRGSWPRNKFTEHVNRRLNEMEQ